MTNEQKIVDTDTAEEVAANEALEEVEYDEDTGAALVKKLREKNKKLEVEKSEYLDALQRMKADVVNRDRAASETQSRVKDMVKEGMLEELLPVLDAFTAAMSGAAWENVDKNWRVGVEYIYSQLVKVLSDNGVEQYGKIGEVYDPLVHDLTEELSEGTVPPEGAVITAVVRAGYKMGTRVVRAAGVRIA
jgi:molecular chaperone GrpE (heat shock protein)